MILTTYGCERSDIASHTVGFPTKRPMEPNNFVAAVVKRNATLAVKCPAKCRRNPEGEYC